MSTDNSSVARLNTVLLIDDNTIDNYAHRLVLETMGVANEVIDFLYAEEALDYLRKADRPPVDLIFLDINMPRMDGFEFLEEYKNLDPTKKSRAVIIMLTSSLSNLDQERAREFADLTDYQSKPLSKDGLNEILSTYFS